MDRLTHAVCGKFAANKPEQWSYPIEQKLEKLAKLNGAYVVAVLDCGRQLKEGLDEGRVDKRTDANTNLVISYRCPPNSSVIDNPSISEAYLKQLKSIAVQNSSAVFLPGRLLNWVNMNGGKTVAHTTLPLRLDYIHWEVASYERFVYLNIRITDENGSEKSEHKENFYKIGMIPSDSSSIEHPNVQVIEILNPDRRTQLETCISEIYDDSIEAYEESQMKTFINVVY